MPPNFKAVGPTEAELHILKVKKLDACIRPLFANSVTNVLYLSHSTDTGVNNALIINQECFIKYME